MRTALWCFVVLAPTAFAGCSSKNLGGSDGAGKAAFSTWGEEFIEEGIPAAEVEDGWTIKYSKFLVVLRAIKVATAAGEVGGEMATAKVFDLTKPGKKAVFELPNLAAKTWDRVSYQIGPIDAQTDAAGASVADKDLMLSGKLAISIVGSATKEQKTKSFKWGFTTNTLLDRCEGNLNGKKTEGVVVTNGGTDSVELTVHGDHFFYDDLQADNAKVRFENIAEADANNDGEITLDELGAKRLVDIPKEKGTYGTGGAGGINDLRAFVTALSRTLGHYRGEGECFAKPL